MSIFVTREYHYDINYNLPEFVKRFNNFMINERTYIGKDIKGWIKNCKFKLKRSEPDPKFTFDMEELSEKGLKLVDFFVLTGNYRENNDKLNLILKLRIKPIIQFFFFFFYAILMCILNSNYTYQLILSGFVLFFYIMMKIGIRNIESFFLLPFKILFDIPYKVEEEKGINYTIQEKKDIKIIKTKKLKIVTNNLFLWLFIISFEYIFYSVKNISIFAIFSCITIIILLSLRQFYNRYKLDVLENSNEVLDFWMLMNRAIFPIPSFLFKLKKTKNVVTEKIRKRYNFQTFLIYIFLILTILYSIKELKIIE